MNSCSPKKSLLSGMVGDYPLPRKGRMARHFDYSKEQLKNSICGLYLNQDVYLYVINTIEISDSGVFIQRGSGPNFQGSEVTLCTCKHFMRSFRTPERWENTWVAGFCSSRYGHENSIVYLMQIDAAYEDFCSLWLDLPERSRKTKDATGNCLGDIYRPARLCLNPKSHECYETPVEGHSHKSKINPAGWIWDIEAAFKGRSPALLRGSPKNTFLWSKPQLRLPFILHRGQKKMNLKELLTTL